MGNPKGVTTTNAPDPIGRDNGIFAAVPGEVIAAGSQPLPPADTMRGQTASVVADAGDLGPVRIIYESRQIKHRRNSYWAWIAMRVDRVPTVATPAGGL